MYPPNNGAVGDSWDSELPIGYYVSRYGGIMGSYVSPLEVEFAHRAMPYDEKIHIRDKHKYRVIKPWLVKVGIVAPAFNQVGGGLQYKVDKPIFYYLNTGYLEEVF